VNEIERIVVFQEDKMRVVGPGGLEPPTRPL
jgi:hypothetical protein